MTLDELEEQHNELELIMIDIRSTSKGLENLKQQNLALKLKGAYVLESFNYGNSLIREYKKNEAKYIANYKAKLEEITKKLDQN